MSYSQKRMPNDESVFPTPPLWLVWYSDRENLGVGHPGRASEQGQVRHFPTLAKSKTHIGINTPTVANRGGVFWADWAIYHWESDRYVKKYEGFLGEPAKGNPLFEKGAATDGLQGESRDPLDEEVEEALASIRAVRIAGREQGWQPA